MNELIRHANADVYRTTGGSRGGVEICRLPQSLRFTRDRKRSRSSPGAVTTG
jgi:hypothetical protein